jgi:hypothetical protein
VQFRRPQAGFIVFADERGVFAERRERHAGVSQWVSFCGRSPRLMGEAWKTKLTQIAIYPATGVFADRVVSLEQLPLVCQ